MGVAVMAAAVGALVAGCSSSSTGAVNPLAPGRGSATVTWKSDTGTGNPSQPFTGTIDGITLSGTALSTITSPSLGSGAANDLVLPARIHAFQWKGTFDGKKFNLGVYLVQSKSGASASPSLLGLTFEIQGSYGADPVKFAIHPPTSLSANNSTPVAFSGTIGALKVVGAVKLPSGSGTRHRGTATFTVGG
jgi:hypothetical protein